jgi:hypothetical protein
MRTRLTSTSSFQHVPSCSPLDCRYLHHVSPVRWTQPPTIEPPKRRPKRLPCLADIALVQTIDVLIKEWVLCSSLFLSTNKQIRIANHSSTTRSQHMSHPLWWWIDIAISSFVVEYMVSEVKSLEPKRRRPNEALNWKDDGSVSGTPWRSWYKHTERQVAPVVLQVAHGWDWWHGR